MVPAVGQGALAVETRFDSVELARQLRIAANDEEVERAITCERAALRALQGGCQAPIGIHARFENGTLRADGVIASLDGRRVLRATVRGKADDLVRAQSLGADLARALLADGAEELLAAPKDSV